MMIVFVFFCLKKGQISPNNEMKSTKCCSHVNSQIKLAKCVHWICCSVSFFLHLFFVFVLNIMCLTAQHGQETKLKNWAANESLTCQITFSTLDFLHWQFFYVKSYAKFWWTSEKKIPMVVLNPYLICKLL